MSSSKRGPGRRKITLEKMQDDKALQVTFSKRRTGAFKKANEICTLTGAKVALIAFSPSHKAFSFGCPDVQTNMNRLLGNGNPPMPTNERLQQMIQAQHDSKSRNLNQELMEHEAILANEKNQAKELRLQKAQGKILNWYPPPTEELSLEELLDLQKFLGNFEKKFLEAKNKAYQMPVDGSSSLLVYQGDVPGSSSNPPLPLGINEFPTGFMDPGMYDPNFCFQDPYEPTLDLVSNEMDFGNHASNDPIGLQVSQDPLPAEYNLSGMVDLLSNGMTYDQMDLQVSNYMNYDPTGIEVSHAPFTSQFDKMDQVPQAPYSHSTGTEITNSYPFSFPPSRFSTDGGSGVYPGESSHYYPFGFPPKEFSTAGGLGVYPGESSNSYPFGFPPIEFPTAGGSGVYPGECSGSYPFALPPTDFSAAGGPGTAAYPGSLNGGNTPAQL